jgi:hypothetical protein
MISRMKRFLLPVLSDRGYRRRLAVRLEKSPKDTP